MTLGVYDIWTGILVVAMKMGVDEYDWIVCVTTDPLRPLLTNKHFNWNIDESSVKIKGLRIGVWCYDV